MSMKKMRVHNDQHFFDDLDKVSRVLVIARKSNAYLTVRKKDLRKEAEFSKIHYELSDTIYKVKRLVMVIL